MQKVIIWALAIVAVLGILIVLELAVFGMFRHRPELQSELDRRNACEFLAKRWYSDEPGRNEDLIDVQRALLNEPTPEEAAQLKALRQANAELQELFCKPFEDTHRRQFPTDLPKTSPIYCSITKAAIDAENVRLQDASCRPDERCRIFDNELLVINDTRRLLLPYIPEGGCAEAKA